MRKIVETLSSTECVERNQLGSEIMKLSKILENSAGQIINTTNVSKGLKLFERMGVKFYYISL